jgi:hypothetical protein
MTHLQSQTEFSFWALFNSPLIVATDVRDMSNKADILLNREVISVNQDPVRFLFSLSLFLSLRLFVVFCFLHSSPIEFIVFMFFFYVL